MLRDSMSPIVVRWTLAIIVAFFESSAFSAPIRLDSRTIEPTRANRVTLVELIQALDASAGGRHVLVQLDRVPDANERRSLAERGLVLEDYIPTRGYLAWLARGAELDPQVRDRVAWSAAIEPTDKMQALLRRGATPSFAVAPDGRLRLVVYAFSGASEPGMVSALESAGAEVVAVLPEFQRYEVVLPAGLVRNVADLDVVRWVRPVNPEPVDDLDALRLDHEIDEVQAVPYGLSGGDIRIGQLEDGNPDDTHDDLMGRVSIIVSGSTSDHATHVAGIAAGDGTLSSGSGGTPLQWRGVAPLAEIVSWLSGGPYLMDYGPAITLEEIQMSTNSWGLTVSSEIGNCSLYGDYDFDAPEHDHIVNGKAYGKPIAILFSAGNERNDEDCGMSAVPPYVNYSNVRPPGATSKNTLTVGAKFSDLADVADFSSWGPTDDGRLKPELVAAGDESPEGVGIYAPVPTDTYDHKSGTSMSTPAVAGAAALFWQEFRGLTASEPLPSTVKALFVQTAEDLANGSSYLNVGPDYASGYGVLKLKEAIDVLREGTWVEAAVDQSEVFGASFTLPSDATWVKITLAWDDEKGAPSAAPALVNDLELVVMDPLSTRHYPWTLTPGTPSAPAAQTSEDHLNPLEQVFVGSSLEPGEWIIDVIGDLVPFGPQSFSLVWSHDGTDPTSTVEGSFRTATLHPSHPNPFRPWTTVSYTLERGSQVKLRVLDVRGRVVRTLESTGWQPPDRYTYTWRGRDDAGRVMPSGIYWVELHADGRRSTQKVTLLR